MQTEKKEAVAKMVEARHRYNIAKQELKKAEVQLKKAMKTGDEEKIAEAQKLVKEKQAVQLEAKEQLNDAITQKKAAVKNRVLDFSPPWKRRGFLTAPNFRPSSLLGGYSTQ